MANQRCKICNKYKPLYGGVCTECKTLRAYEINKTIQEEVYKSEFHNADENAFIGYTKYLMKNIDAEKSDESEYEKYLKMSPEEKKKWELNRVCEMNDIDEATKLRYRPQLLQIVKKYRGHLLDGDVSLCTREEYENTGKGEVCDIIGNFVIRRFVNTKEDGVEIRKSILVDTDTLLKFLLGEESIEDIEGEELTDIVSQVQLDADDMGIDIEDLESDIDDYEES